VYETPVVLALSVYCSPVALCAVVRWFREPNGGRTVYETPVSSPLAEPEQARIQDLAPSALPDVARVWNAGGWV
jgi:hypothetical protein